MLTREENIKWLRNRIVDCALQIARCKEGWYLENQGQDNQYNVIFCRNDIELYKRGFEIKLESYAQELLHLLSSVSTDE